MSSIKRQSTDVFTFFCFDKISDITVTLEDYIQLKSLQSIEPNSIVKMNFNPFDEAFNCLIFKQETLSKTINNYDLRHPDIPEYNFYINKTELIVSVKPPKNKKNMYVIGDSAIKDVISKYSINL